MGTHRHRNHSNHSTAFLTIDPHMLSVLKTADKVAPTEVPVLIEGESGTGKEVLARRIHQNSQRASKPLVSLNCGAIQESLLLSELFGHEKGAFTGAISQKVGLVELADGGTLFLDEIGEMGLETQAKLLRFLQEGEIYRVGGKTPIQVDVRVISATNRELAARTQEGRFREDLYYRINTVTLRITPLRQRPCDIPVLAEAFLNQGTQTRVKMFSEDALQVLRQYRWPGNARELQNAVERFKILVEAETISGDDVPKHLRLGRREPEIPEASDTFDLSLIEKRHILRVLAHFSGNKTKAANAMGITVKTLYNKLARYEQETAH
ncbi:sigma-54 dependent transcriptional regulator [bacterium]|nr:sigma-54 dependent transcriptional regulator [bacterium]